MERIKNKIVASKDWLKKYEKYLSIAFFTGGLVLDNLTLTRIDQLFDNLVLLSYVLLAIGTIFLINLFQSREIENKWTGFLPFITQFAFGGLFSGYIIFYTKSASFTTSWIFLLIIFAIFIGNERFRNSYKKIDFQIKILFVALFSYLIFFIPVVLKRVGDWIFVLSGVVSLVVIYALMFVFFRYISSLGARREKSLIKNIFFIYLVFNLMYFTNIIPPVPLSLKHLEVYNYVEKTFDGNYLVREQKLEWYEAYKDWFNKVYKIPNTPIYVFASVFAPTDLNTNITHIWQRYDENSNRWFTVNKVTYPISGGRGEGYRGYSFINNATDGRYRVYVKNKQGQTLGKIKFKLTEIKNLQLENEEI